MLKHERAVEAACIRAFEETPTAWGVLGDDWRENVSDPTKENYRIIVRAAVAAFLENVEPSEAMLKAADRACDDHGQVLMTSGWRVMSKALADEVRARADGEG